VGRLSLLTLTAARANSLIPTPTPLIHLPTPHHTIQVAIKLESVKTKHPQLLYESKIYRILYGGSESSGVECADLFPLTLPGPSLATTHAMDE
jgi:hypothetical protein